MKNTETYAKAVDRIRDEMAKEANHPGIQFLGGWLTGELVKRPELAEKLGVIIFFQALCDQVNEECDAKYGFDY